MEKARIEAENHGPLLFWYEIYGEFLKKCDIQPNELYNWDETGFQLGIGTSQNVVSTCQNEVIGTGGIGQNVTGIECISADGWVMHPWFLFCGSDQMDDWYDRDDYPDHFKVIKLITKGWSDDMTAIQWLLDFHYATKKRVTRGRPRVLLMDNHGSHGTPEFEYLCQCFNIIPYWFLPKLTHRCQPLDGKPFSILKLKFRLANNEHERWGGDPSDKRGFLQLIKNVRKETFKAATIKSSFKDTGLWPFNGTLVPNQIDPQWENEPTIRILGHSSATPETEISSSATNSPPNTRQRFTKIEDKMTSLFEDEEPDLPKIQKHIKRAIEGGKQVITELNLANQTIKKQQKHRIPNPKSRRIIKGASKSPLSSISGNSRAHRRALTDSRVDVRFEDAQARRRDYWRRANNALKEAEIAKGGTDYMDENDELFPIIDKDRMVGDK